MVLSAELAYKIETARIKNEVMCRYIMRQTPVFRISDWDELRTPFNSIKDACFATPRTDSSNISRALKTGGTAGGYRWKKQRSPEPEEINQRAIIDRQPNFRHCKVCGTYLPVIKKYWYWSRNSPSRTCKECTKKKANFRNSLKKEKPL